MKVKSIPIEEVIIPDVRVTAVYDEEQLQLLHSTVETLGILTPIIVSQDGEKYILVDGLHRLQEARASGQTKIDAVVSLGDPAETLLKNLVLNRVRGKVKASEMVTAIASLYQDFGLDVDQVVSRTGLGRDYVERLIKVSSASPSVLAELDAERIGVGHAYELSRLPSHEAQDEALFKLSVWKWPIKDLHKYIDETIALIPEMKELLQSQKERSTPPPPPKVYTCQACGATGGASDMRPVLLCPGCAGQVWQAAHSTGHTIPGNAART